MELSNLPSWQASLEAVRASENRTFALLNADLELVRSLEQNFKKQVEAFAAAPPPTYLGLTNLLSILSFSSSPPNARFLYDLDVHLELLKTHLIRLGEKQFLLNYEHLALGGFWAILKALEKSLEFLSVQLASACSKEFAAVRLDQLEADLKPTCALIQNFLPLFTLIQTFPADPSGFWLSTDELERRQPKEVAQLREPAIYRIGYTYDATLLAYARKLDVIYCTIADSYHISLALRHVAFSTALMRHSAVSADEAARRANDIRRSLSLEVLRGVWNIVEDPVLRFFAEKMGYFPKLRVAVDFYIPLSISASSTAISLRIVSNNKSSVNSPLVQMRRSGSSNANLNLLSSSSSSSSLHSSSSEVNLVGKEEVSSGGGSVLGTVVSWMSTAVTLPSTALFHAVSSAASVFSRVDVSLKDQCGKFDTSAACVLHIHGGGWVSQTSETHITYLREWARQLNVPVFSINYTLAPESQFPVALEQCFLTYTWIRENFAQLGFAAAPKIFLAGDSAGGNLAAALTVKLLQENLTPPAGVLLLYPALYIGPHCSLSRLTFLNDPILTYSTLMLCLHAYVPAHVGPRSWEDPLLSPGNASDELLSRFPPTQIMVGDIDPLLDDALYFTRRLLKLDRSVSLRLYENLPHGFMNVADQLPHCQPAIRDSVLALEKLLEAACPLPPPESSVPPSSSPATVTVT